VKEFYKSIIYYFINSIVNRIPSRYIRISIYNFLSKGRISKKASIAMGVKFLDIRKVSIGDRSNINSGCILDGRGEGIEISHDTDIAPQVNIWSLEHNPNSPTHETRSGLVKIDHHVWIANRAIILPNTRIGAGTTIGAQSVVKGQIENNSICVGNPFKIIKKRAENPIFHLRKLRRFR
jgi:acetyltransferase-like isoleucine patch superfamily enzyme